MVDHTNGFKLGNIDGSAPNATGFIGNHSVYFVYDSLDPTENWSRPYTLTFISWAKASTQRPIRAAFGFAL
ncbi:hypothetical protein [Embleya sp. NPDC001921]